MIAGDHAEVTDQLCALAAGVPHVQSLQGIHAVCGMLLPNSHPFSAACHSTRSKASANSLICICADA